MEILRSLCVLILIPPTALSTPRPGPGERPGLAHPVALVPAPAHVGAVGAAAHGGRGQRQAHHAPADLRLSRHARGAQQDHRGDQGEGQGGRRAGETRNVDNRQDFMSL